MIASVQYNDLTGTAAADVSDYYNNSLQNYLKETFCSFNSDRYKCRGCTIHISGQCVSPAITIRFLCWDNQEDKHVSFKPQKEISLNEAFYIFKRFNIVIGKNVNDIKVESEDYYDL